MSNAHALIIDDNSNNIDVLSGLLTLEGVTNTTMKSASQLNRVIDELDQIDVIFLDLEMPDADGYSVLDNIKADPRLEGVPVVAYTVHVSEIGAARKLGFHSFLGKPIDAERFPEQLRDILNGQSVWSVP